MSGALVAVLKREKQDTKVMSETRTQRVGLVEAHHTRPHALFRQKIGVRLKKLSRETEGRLTPKAITEASTPRNN